MDSTQLAEAMLKYGKLMDEAAALETQIKAAVLEVGKTQTVGNVRATFSNPRKTYQSWEDAVMDNEPDGFVPEDYLVYAEPQMDWQKAGKDFGIERESWIAEDAKPSVSVKLI